MHFPAGSVWRSAWNNLLSLTCLRSKSKDVLSVWLLENTSFSDARRIIVGIRMTLILPEIMAMMVVIVIVVLLIIEILRRIQVIKATPTIVLII